MELRRGEIIYVATRWELLRMGSLMFHCKLYNAIRKDGIFMCFKKNSETTCSWEGKGGYSILALRGALHKVASSLLLAWNFSWAMSPPACRDQDYYYGVTESGSVGYVKQVHVTRDLKEAITAVQPLQE